MTTMTATKLPRFKSVLGWKVLNLYVDPHPGQDNSDRVPVDCARCGGSGWTCFKWVEGGICFDCRGSGRDTISAGTARKHAKSAAFAAEYGDEVAVYWAAVEARNEVARKAAEFDTAWDEAHAEKTRREAMVGGFIGEVGDKVKGLSGVVNVATTYESHFGYRTQIGKFLIITVEGGQVVKIAGTGNSLFGIERGDEVTITGGTIKGHETYNGQDQTVLTRAKLVRIEKEVDLDE